MKHDEIQAGGSVPSQCASPAYINFTIVYTMCRCAMLTTMAESGTNLWHYTIDWALHVHGTVCGSATQVVVQ